MSNDKDSQSKIMAAIGQEYVKEVDLENRACDLTTTMIGMLIVIMLGVTLPILWDWDLHGKLHRDPIIRIMYTVVVVAFSFTGCVTIWTIRRYHKRNINRILGWRTTALQWKTKFDKEDKP